MDFDFVGDDIINKPTFTIGTAAELAGVHQQTLRLWEQKGLITPYRSPGGTRMYSMNDLSRIDRIQRMSAEGISIVGMQRIFALEERVSHLTQRCAVLSYQNKKMASVLSAIMAQSRSDENTDIADGDNDNMDSANESLNNDRSQNTNAVYSARNTLFPLFVIER